MGAALAMFCNYGKEDLGRLKVVGASQHLFTDKFPSRLIKYPSIYLSIYQRHTRTHTHIHRHTHTHTWTHTHGPTHTQAYTAPLQTTSGFVADLTGIWR